MNIQSSRKIIRTKIVSVIILIAILFSIPFLAETAEGGMTITDCLKMSFLFIVVLCVDLFYTDWSIKIKDNMLFVRKGIFKYKISFDNLISIQENSNSPVDSTVHYESLIIKYERENKTKHLKINYLSKSPFFKIEYAKKSEISKLINTYISKKIKY